MDNANLRRAFDSIRDSISALESAIEDMNTVYVKRGDIVTKGHETFIVGQCRKKEFVLINIGPGTGRRQSICPAVSNDPNKIPLRDLIGSCFKVSDYTVEK